MKTVKFEEAVFNQAIKATNAWNFELAVKKLLEVKSGQWDLNRAEAAVRNYKRYMAVTKALGGVQLVPNGDIDEIWHKLGTISFFKSRVGIFRQSYQIHA